MVERLWDQLPGESDRAYKVFQVYLSLKPPRSIRKAYNISRGREGKETSPPFYVYRWAKMYKWKQRARAYDAHQNKKREMSPREQKIAELDAKLIEIVEKLLKQAESILNFPLVKEELIEQKVEDGGKTIINQYRLTPVGFRKRDAATLLSILLQIREVVKSLETDRTSAEELHQRLREIIMGDKGADEVETDEH